MKYSNAYIFRYSAIMVIIVAIMLTGAARLLKPKQDNNIKIEKIQGILSSANIASEKSNAEKTYNEHLIREIAVNEKGEIISVFQNQKLEIGSIRPFNINLKDMQTLHEKKLNNEAISQEPLYPVIILEHNSDTLFVFPMRGRGLWGPLYGNIALKSDLNTIAGAVFEHDKETPGLGAEINQEWFEKQFIGKKIFNETDGSFLSVKVVKGGIKNSSLPEIHGVDAISGGTITSDGLSNMIKSNFEIYLPYIKK